MPTLSVSRQPMTRNFAVSSMMPTGALALQDASAPTFSLGLQHELPVMLPVLSVEADTFVQSR